MAGGISVLSWSRATEEREQFARLIGQGLATPRRAGSCGETAGPGHGGGSGELASHPLGVRGETNSCSTHPGPCPTRKRVPVRNAAGSSRRSPRSGHFRHCPPALAAYILRTSTPEALPPRREKGPLAWMYAECTQRVLADSGGSGRIVASDDSNQRRFGPEPVS